MLSIEECQKHIAKLNLPDNEVEKIRELLYAFVERTLDYTVENGMLVDTSPCEVSTKKVIQEQR